MIGRLGPDVEQVDGPGLRSGRVEATRSTTWSADKPFQPSESRLHMTAYRYPAAPTSASTPASRSPYGGRNHGLAAGTPVFRIAASARSSSDRRSLGPSGASPVE